MDTLEALVRSFVETHPEGAARALENIEEQEAARVLERLPPGTVGPVVERLTPHAAAAILEHLRPEYTPALLEAMTSREAALALQRLDEEKREQALSGVSEETARVLRNLLRYPPETAGGMMEPHVASIAVDLTVEEAIALLRRTPREALYYLYVTDRHGRLEGVVNVRDLLLARPSDRIDALLYRELTMVPATMDREEVATLMRQRRFVALPVVDPEGCLIGVVKHEQALETVQQEAFEDLQKLVGAGGDERATSPVSTVVRKRLPWLYVNLVTAFAAAAVVGLFEDVLARVTALAVLLPVVSGQGGNSGAQTLAVVIRGLALREIIPGVVRRMLLKEMIVACLNGFAIAAVAATAVYAWSRSIGLAVVIGLAMIVNMLVAGLAGAAIPLVLQRLGRDPAQSSSIFLTTITDIVGFASFLGFAAIVLPLLS